MTTTIPTTREEAIRALVELDVSKWGEGERAASERANASLSYGRALNTLGNRLGDDAIRAAAKASMTKQDRSELRKGG